MARKRTPSAAPSTDAGGGPVEPKRRGRPKSDDSLDVRLDVRMTTAEREELERAASDAGQPLRTYIRDAALARAREQRGEPAPVAVPLDEAIEALEGLARRQG